MLINAFQNLEIVQEFLNDMIYDGIKLEEKRTTNSYISILVVSRNTSNDSAGNGVLSDGESVARLGEVRDPIIHVANVDGHCRVVSQGGVDIH